jgi:hypothetical protein
MDEKGLLDLWNTKRTQVINAQIAPTLMLIGVFVLATFGKFETATYAAKYLTIGVAAATGILAIISQYATIREAEVLLLDLKKLEKPSALSKKISDSRNQAGAFLVGATAVAAVVAVLIALKDRDLGLIPIFLVVAPTAVLAGLVAASGVPLINTFSDKQVSLLRASDDVEA